MTTIDHLFAIYLLVVSAVLSGVLGTRRLRAPGADRPRSRTYLFVVLRQWGRTAACVLLWMWMRRPLADLGLSFALNTGTVGALLGLGLVVAYMARQRQRALADVDGRDEIRERLEPMRVLLPHSRDEYRGFAVVAVTAGICEELLFRGYLTWYFAHVMPWWAAMVAVAVAFGFGHAYQGARGVLTTALLGLFLGALYWLTGSLVVPMLVHALMDLHSGDLAWRVYEAEAGDFRASQDRDDDEGGPSDAA